MQERTAGPRVVDGHNDLPWRARELVDGDWGRLDISRPCGQTHTDLPRLRAGGVAAQFWSVFVPAGPQDPDPVVATLEQIEVAHRMIEAHPRELALVTHPGQVAQAWESGRIASMLGAEGGHSIGSSLGALRALFRLGVRYLTLTHNEHTPWADCALREPLHHGLTAFGREVVAEMNRLGMLVDLAHVSADTMRDAIDASRAPVIVSHSNARAVVDVPRNVPDDVLASLAAGGGVCCVTFVAAFTSARVAAWEARTGREACTPDAPRATIDEVVAHIEHVREVAGVAHVGLGGDFDGADAFPVGLEDVAGYPRLFAALADRGWSRADLDALAGENLLRAWRDAADAAG